MLRPRLLVVHSGRYGQSEKVARFLADDLEQLGFSPDVLGLADFAAPVRQDCDGLIMVTSVHYGHVRPQSTAWAIRQRDFLATLPTCLVVVSLSNSRSGRADPALSGPVQSFQAKTGWRPSRIALVAGSVEYPKYGFLDRQMMRQIMKARGGPTDTSASYEYTDWPQVAGIGRDFADLLVGGRSLR
jgi:menaquinone-dependent protoporphyrinogen oxidase